MRDSRNTGSTHILGKVGSTQRESASLTKPPTRGLLESLHCPECASQRIYKDGFRYVKTETGREIPIQRFLCRACGRRFSEPMIEPNIRRKPFKRSHPTNDCSQKRVLPGNQAAKEVINNTSLSSCKDVGSHAESQHITSVVTFIKGSHHSRTRQVCATDKVAKNLSTVKTQTKTAGEIQKHLKGKLIEFSWYLKKQGYAKSREGIAGTIETRTRMVTQLARLGANLYDPESVKETIALQEWKGSTSSNYRYAYECFMKMEGLTWDPPHYKKTQTLPFVPYKEEIDLLINACGKKASIFLEGLKETGADPGELIRIGWSDINEKAGTLIIRNPVKDHNSRALTVSRSWLARLKLLHSKRDRVFPMFLSTMRSNYNSQRRRKAAIHQKPRLLKVSFTSIRHWKATLEYHKTKDILHVKQLLGHKNIKNTMIYIDIERAVFGDERNAEYITRVAKSVKGARSLIEAGFQYVTEMDGYKLFRKRK